MKRGKRWDELSRRQQVTVVVASTVEVVLTTVALIDLARRPSRLVRGSKRGWAMACFVQPVGPIAYLAFGRR
jgi:hypothetical protein